MDKPLISKRTLYKIAQDPEAFARLFLENVGTDALEDFMDDMYRVWSAEGSHK